MIDTNRFFVKINLRFIAMLMASGGFYKQLYNNLIK